MLRAVRQRFRADAAIDSGFLDLDFLGLLLLLHLLFQVQEKVALLRRLSPGDLARFPYLLGVYSLPYRARRGVTVAEVDGKHS